MGNRLEQVDWEAAGSGLLPVDLLELRRKFCRRRYGADLGGFLLAWGLVGALMLLVGIARAREVRSAGWGVAPVAGFADAEKIPAVDARFQVRDLNTPMSFHPYPTREAWQARATSLRRQILMAAGLWPMPERTALEARVFDRIERDGYTIEKVYFQSYPGFYSTGNLYRPRGRAGRFPGVWSPHGHWAYGRLHHDEIGSVVARAVNLARQGYVVFTPDMVGYNDSQQVSHQFGGPRESLWGINVLGLQLWNSIRGLDFLESLPDVDPDRLLMTGASGGGTQTFLATAVDERVKVSVPVNMVSAHMQGGSNCENAPNLRLDTFNVEFAAMAAPRPLLLVAATGDWTKNNPTVEFPAVESIYKLFGAAGNVAVQQFNYGHNYNRDSREAMYAFFARWALDEKDPAKFKERSFRPEFPPQVLVFYGRQRPAGVNEQALVEQRIAAARRQLAALRPFDGESLARFREVYGVALLHSLAAQMPAASEVLAEESEPGRLLLGRRGRGDRIPAALWRPKRPGKRPAPVALLVHPEGKEAAGKSPLATELLRRGVTILSLDAFQTGEHIGKRDTSARFFTTYNRTDDAERVQDILTGLAYLKSRPEFSAVDLVGTGRAGLWVLLARALAPADAVRRTAADADRFETGSDSAYLEKLPIPLIRRAGDFRTAATLVAPAPLLIHNTGALFQTDWAVNAYRAASREASLSLREAQAGDLEVAAWLLAR